MFILAANHSTRLYHTAPYSILWPCDVANQLWLFVCLFVRILGHFVEALRQLQLLVKKENFCLVHVSMVPMMGESQEQKTKPTQHRWVQSSHMRLIQLGWKQGSVVRTDMLSITSSTSNNSSVLSFISPWRVNSDELLVQHTYILSVSLCLSFSQLISTLFLSFPSLLFYPSHLSPLLHRTALHCTRFLSYSLEAWKNWDRLDSRQTSLCAEQRK